MSIDRDPRPEAKPKYWNAEFERSYGDLLVTALRKMSPNAPVDVIETEVDFFYYKLRVLQSLVDPLITVSTPSKRLFDLFRDFDNFIVTEFENFAGVAGLILMEDKTAEQILTEPLLEECENVINNPDRASFYFKLGNPQNNIN